MGAAEEGALLRVAYVKKMDKIDADKKQCRKDIETLIAPQIALMDEFGHAGHAGPARIIKDEAELQSEAGQLAQLQAELVRLGKILNQTANKESPLSAKVVRQFEQRLREYARLQKSFDKRSDSLVSKSERAFKNFVPFARAVLAIKKQQACEDIWSDLRTSIPRNMEAVLTKNRARVKQQVASLKANQQNFGMQASKMLLRFKTKSQIALETFDEE